MVVGDHLLLPEGVGMPSPVSCFAMEQGVLRVIENGLCLKRITEDF